MVCFLEDMRALARDDDDRRTDSASAMYYVRTTLMLQVSAARVLLFAASFSCINHCPLAIS